MGGVSSTYRTTIRVRFGDEDHARIVYFPRFLHFFHCAFEDFFDDNGFEYRRMLDEDHVGWPAVRVETDFRSPLRFGDIMTIDVSVRRIGEKSATFHYRGTRQDNGKLVATAEITNACMDMRTYRAIPIPQPYRDFFAPFLIRE